MKRMIYSNYDIYTDENMNAAIETLELNNIPVTPYNVDDQIIEDARENWELEKERLTAFLDSMPGLIIGGYVGRWNGNYSGFYNADTFEDIFNHATADCDYWELWDENGHLFLKCSHHDGTNLFEIKALTEKGAEQLQYNFNYSAVFGSNFYSRLPHFAFNVYGCKKYDHRKDVA